MSFSVGTNLDALKAYNALTKINNQTQKAQNRLATGKRINSVADDTSGYRVAKELEALTAKQKSQLNNASSAKNYLATAETALQLVNDLFNQISAKYVDSQDPTKNKSSLADDIRALAGEINSILKTTNFNGHNILANSDGSALTATDTFDIGGGSFLNVDFSDNNYLKVDDLNSLINGGGSGGGLVGELFNPGNVYYEGDIDSSIQINYSDGSNETFTVHIAQPIDYTVQLDEIALALESAMESSTNVTTDYNVTNGGLAGQFINIENSEGKTITSFSTLSGNNLVSALGLNNLSIATGGACLLSATDSEVIDAAKNLTTVQSNVQSALGRIGNLSQMADTRSSYLTESITNGTDTISRLFDADMAEEQLIATRGSISNQIATSMFSKFLSAPQQLLVLFQ